MRPHNYLDPDQPADVITMKGRHHMSAIAAEEIARRFALASLTYRPPEPGGPIDLSQTEAATAINEGLSMVCQALSLPPGGLGTCWRALPKWPREPQLKIVVWQQRRYGEDGNFAPACGTINLFGTASSLFHELGHAIDFQLNHDGPPWSHSETWMSALASTPQFCKNAMPAMNRSGRVRLSDMYLSAPHETFARVFECFVIDRGGADWPSRPDTTCQRSYPQDDERALLCDVIKQHVVTQLRTRISATTET